MICRNPIRSDSFWRFFKCDDKEVSFWQIWTIPLTHQIRYGRYHSQSSCTYIHLTFTMLLCNLASWLNEEMATLKSCHHEPEGLHFCSDEFQRHSVQYICNFQLHIFQICIRTLMDKCKLPFTSSPICIYHTYIKSAWIVS